MPSYHLLTSDDAEVTDAEVIVAQGASTGTAHFITGKLPSFELSFTGNLTAHCATRLTINTTWQNRYVNFATHTHRSNWLATTLNISPVQVQVPHFIHTLNTCMIFTHYVSQR
jgi:hypothetical protein